MTRERLSEEERLTANNLEALNEFSEILGNVKTVHLYSIVQRILTERVTAARLAARPLSETIDYSTPRPWRLDEYKGGRRIVVDLPGGPCPIQIFNNRFNAELIVSAVNDHSQLVEKVRGLAAKWQENAREMSGYEATAILTGCADELLRALGDGR